MRVFHGSRRVTKREWYEAGGFANSACWRMADSLGRWRHYIVNEYEL